MIEMRLGDLELAGMQVAALYVHDAGGRLLRVNEPDPEHDAPRFFLARTAAGNLWRIRHDLPGELVVELERMAADEPVVVDPREPPRHAAAYVALFEQHAPLGDRYAGPAYYLQELAPPTGEVTITRANAALLQAHFPYTLSRLAALAPVVVIVTDGAAVAACFSARITAQVAEAGVHTVKGYRGRGYGAEVVRGWAIAIRALGRLPLYSTWWANAASLAVAKKLRAVRYAVEFSLG